jgi:hypothetical protein
MGAKMWSRFLYVVGTIVAVCSLASLLAPSVGWIGWVEAVVSGYVQLRDIVFDRIPFDFSSEARDRAVLALTCAEIAGIRLRSITGRSAASLRLSGFAVSLSMLPVVLRDFYCDAPYRACLFVRYRVINRSNVAHRLYRRKSHALDTTAQNARLAIYRSHPVVLDTRRKLLAEIKPNSIVLFAVVAISAVSALLYYAKYVIGLPALEERFGSQVVYGSGILAQFGLSMAWFIWRWMILTAALVAILAATNIAMPVVV